MDGDGKVVWAEVRSATHAGGERPDVAPLALEDEGPEEDRQRDSDGEVTDAASGLGRVKP